MHGECTKTQLKRSVRRKWNYPFLTPCASGAQRAHPCWRRPVQAAIASLTCGAALAIQSSVPSCPGQSRLRDCQHRPLARVIGIARLARLSIRRSGRTARLAAAASLGPVASAVEVTIHRMLRRVLAANGRVLAAPPLHHLCDRSSKHRPSRPRSYVPSARFEI